jgi:type II secretory pathway pseudopilin PulG
MRVGNRKAQLRANGFTYVTVLVLVVVMSLGLAVAGPKWSEARQRDREDELVRIGVLYAQAITSYYESSPGSLKQYPPSLDSLLLDSRFIGTRRHLRRLYTDPLMPGRPLQLIQGSDGTVRGVFSASEREPFRRAPMRFDGVADIPPATQHRQWAFVAAPKK